MKKEIDAKIVKSVNKNVRSSTRKLKPILKQFHQQLQMQKIIINMT